MHASTHLAGSHSPITRFFMPDNGTGGGGPAGGSGATALSGRAAPPAVVVAKPAGGNRPANGSKPATQPGGSTSVDMDALMSAAIEGAPAGEEPEEQPGEEEQPQEEEEEQPGEEEQPQEEEQPGGNGNDDLEAWLAEQPADVQERFNALQEARDAAAAEAEEARAAAAEAGKKPDQPKPDDKKAAKKPAAANPLAGINTAQELADRMDHAEQLRSWAIENWEGATVTPTEGDPYDLTPAEVRQIFNREDTILRKWGPQREQAIAQSARSMEGIKESHPFMKDTGSQGYQMFQALSTYPALEQLRAQVTDWPTFLADAVAGRLARDAKGASAGARTNQISSPKNPSPAPGGVKPKAPGLRVPPSGGAGGARSTTSNPRQSAALAAAAKAGGTPDSIAALLQATGA